MEESNDLSLNRHSTEHIFCGFGRRRRSSQQTNYENYYYGMDEGSDQTTYSEEDDEYDETMTDDNGSSGGDGSGDCESSFQYAPNGQMSGRLLRRNVTTRLDRVSENDNNFRTRSKWRKYHYQAVPRSMPIQEEDEEVAGPSSITPTTSSIAMAAPNGTNTINNAIKSNTTILTMDDRNKHIIIHVNELKFDGDDDDDDDELSFDEEEICFEKKSISENDSLLVAYDSNSISSV